MYDLNELKDKVAVIGVGNTKYGNFPEILGPAPTLGMPTVDCEVTPDGAMVTYGAQKTIQTRRAARSIIPPYRRRPR